MKESNLIIKGVSAGDQGFLDLKTRIETPSDEIVLLQNRPGLGDATEYTFVTITTRFSNINYKTVENLRLDIIPSQDYDNQITLYTRDVQYVEINPFSSSMTMINLLIKTKSSNKEDIINILKDNTLQIHWGKNYKKDYTLGDIL